jgi:hypothetical protein
MKLRFKQESDDCEIEAIEMSEDEYKLLSRLVGQLSRNDLLERGFTAEESEKITAWHQCF